MKMLLLLTVLVVFILSLVLLDFIFSLRKLFILYVKTASLLALNKSIYYLGRARFTVWNTIGGFHVTSSPPCWWTVNKRSLISSLCLSTSICSFHHCYLCLPRLLENHLFHIFAAILEKEFFIWSVLECLR